GAVLLQGVELALHGTGEGVDGFGGGAAEHGGEVGALLDQVPGLGGDDVQGEAGVGELGADDGGELGVFGLGQADGGGGGGGPLLDGVGFLPDPGVHATHGQLSPGGGLDGVGAELDQRGADQGDRG